MSDSTDTRSGVVRNWWPITELKWNAEKLGAYWAPDDLNWSFPQLSGLPRIPHAQLYPNNFKFEKTQALVSYQAVFENTAESMGKNKRRGAKTPPSSPPPPPPTQTDPDCEYDDTWGGGYASWDQQAQNTRGGGW